MLKGFRHHVKHEHNMWNYIYFHLYLERIDISDHNASESYTYHKVSLMAIDESVTIHVATVINASLIVT